jgi:hypothetical protein
VNLHELRFAHQRHVNDKKVALRHITTPNADHIISLNRIFLITKLRATSLLPVLVRTNNNAVSTDDTSSEQHALHYTEHTVK